MMTFREIFTKILEEAGEGSDITVREEIARSITEKAANGDVNAVKFLREMVDDEKSDTDIPQEIRIRICE